MNSETGALYARYNDLMSKLAARFKRLTLKAMLLRRFAGGLDLRKIT